MKNISTRDALVELAGSKGMDRGRGRAGQYWGMIRAPGTAMIAYHPKEDVTYFHNSAGILVHEEPGDTMEMSG